MIDITKINDISVLHLFGEISLMEVEMIAALIQSLRKNCHNKIVLDLAQVDHVHFKAVRKWAETAQALRQSNGDLKIVSANKETKEVLRFTGADQFLEDYTSAGEAILSFLRSSDLLNGDPGSSFWADHTTTQKATEADDAQEQKKRDTGVWIH